jgi:hypothetical protein
MPNILNALFALTFIHNTMRGRYKRYWDYWAMCILLLCTASPQITVVQAAPIAVEAEYQVSMNGMTIATLHEHFSVQQNKYQSFSELRPSGLLAIVKPNPIQVTSVGLVLRTGLQPLQFEGGIGEAESKRVSAQFDWKTLTLQITHNGRSEQLVLSAGLQDRLSVMYQFLYLSPAQVANLSFEMTNGRNVETYHYQLGPDQEIDTPLGKLHVLHLVRQRPNNEPVVEVWLAKDQQLMPVKMRIIERNGSRYEQLISRLKLQL